MFHVQISQFPPHTSTYYSKQQMWKMLIVFRFVVSKACQCLLCSRITCQFNEIITSIKACYHGYSNITENLEVYLVVFSHCLPHVFFFLKKSCSCRQAKHPGIEQEPGTGSLSCIFLSPCIAFSSSPLHVSVFRLLIQRKILHMKSDATCYLSRIYNSRQKACTQC